MWYLYLDESGDLGFDFVNGKPSKFFTITVLALRTVETNRMIIKSVQNVLHRKFPEGAELKGASCPLHIKKYFYEKIRPHVFSLYAMTLNKRRVFEELTKDKERVYNYIARLVLEKIPFEQAETRIQIIIDKSKTKANMRGFNEYIVRQLKSKVNPKAPLDIYHYDSKESLPLQAVDMFCWGIFRKYEHKDTVWFDVYKEKVVFEEQYL